MLRSRSKTQEFITLLDIITQPSCKEPDLVLVLELCDLIKNNDVIYAEEVLALIKDKLFSSNSNTAYCALLVLESLVKNCGSQFHDALTTNTFSSSLYYLVTTTPHHDVCTKLLELIKVWNYALGPDNKNEALLLRARGYKFPSICKDDAKLINVENKTLTVSEVAAALTPRDTEKLRQEEEEMLQLAIALSKSEIEAGNKGLVT